MICKSKTIERTKKFKIDRFKIINLIYRLERITLKFNDFKIIQKRMLANRVKLINLKAQDTSSDRS